VGTRLPVKVLWTLGVVLAILVLALLILATAFRISDLLTEGMAEGQDPPREMSSAPETSSAPTGASPEDTSGGEEPPLTQRPSLEPADVARIDLGLEGAISFVASPEDSPDPFVGDLLAVPLDGGEPRRVTSAVANYTNPAWSPDGRTVTFENEDMTPYIMDADGSNRRPILMADATENGPVSATAFAWSPDGTVLAFAGNANNQHMSIWTVNADGSGLQRVSDKGAAYYSPGWAADGDSILAFKFEEGESDLVVDGIYSLPLDGAAERRLPVEVSGGYDAAFSPLGGEVAFASQQDSQIYAVKLDGTDFRQIAGGEGNKLAPSWSPDGKFIAYQRETGDGNDIFVAGRDGSDPTNLTRSAASETSPAWVP
jgi:Tol biopolymer transport system component